MPMADRVCPCCQGCLLTAAEDEVGMCEDCEDEGNAELDAYFENCEANPRELGGD